MKARNAINAPSEISTSAKLKLISKNGSGDGIQSMTCPKKNLSRKFDKAPPDIIARPIRVNLLIFANKLTKIKITQEIPDKIKINSGESENKLNAAPVLYERGKNSEKKFLAACSIKTQAAIIVRLKNKIS